jgi:hypothetical protein
VTIAMTLNIVFAAIAFAAVIGGITWGIATARRDPGVTLSRRARRTRRAPAWPSYAPAAEREAA